MIVALEDKLTNVGHLHHLPELMSLFFSQILVLHYTSLIYKQIINTSLTYMYVVINVTQVNYTKYNKTKFN